MKKRKTVLYHAIPAKRIRRCEFEVWNKTTRRADICGVDHALDVKGPNGGHVAYLCQEHAEFFIDAHDMRSEEEKVNG